jgi:hypothetical protein
MPVADPNGARVGNSGRRRPSCPRGETRIIWVQRTSVMFDRINCDSVTDDKRVHTWPHNQSFFGSCSQRITYSLLVAAEIRFPTDAGSAAKPPIGNHGVKRARTAIPAHKLGIAQPWSRHQLPIKNEERKKRDGSRPTEHGDSTHSRLRSARPQIPRLRCVVIASSIFSPTRSN